MFIPKNTVEQSKLVDCQIEQVFDKPKYINSTDDSMMLDNNTVQNVTENHQPKETSTSINYAQKKSKSNKGDSKVKCDRCGKDVAKKNLSRHKKTSKCKNHTDC